MGTSFIEYYFIGECFPLSDLWFSIIIIKTWILSEYLGDLYTPTLTSHLSFFVASP